MLYYLHGYESSPNGSKGVLFKKYLNANAIKYRDCEPKDIIISNCIKCIDNTIKNDKKVILIGSSFGGFLAAKISMENQNIKQIILLNPAIIPPKIDIKKIKDMPSRILKEMVDNRLFQEKINKKINIISGINDEIVPPQWVIEFAMFQEAEIKFLNDDHRLTNYIDKLPNIIRKNLID